MSTDSDAGLRLASDLTLPREAVTQKFAVFGQSGSGKSYAALKLAEEMLHVGAQVIALDPVGIWYGLRSSADGRGAGFPITVFGGEHGDLPLPPGSAALVARLLAERGISAVLDIAEYELPDHKRFVRDFAEAFFQAKKSRRSPVHLFFEEAQVVAPMNPDRDETTMLNRIERLARIGRNYGVGWTIVSQRPQDVHTKVRNQAGTLLAMRTIGTHERKAIAEWVSDKARTKGEASAIERLPELPTGTALVWSPAFLQLSATVAIAPRSTFDSSKTPEFGGDDGVPAVLAPVDVEMLRAALTDVTAEAQAHDPAALRAQLADLARQLRQAQARPTAPPTAPPPERIVERVEVPVVPRGLLDRLDRAEQSLLRWLPVIRDTGDQMERLATELREGRDALLAAPPAPTRVARGPAPALDRETATAPSAVPRSPRPAPGTGQPLPGGARRILTVLAQYPQGRSRVQVAILAEYSSKGGGFGNLLGALRTQGYIVGSDPLRITEAGRAALGDWTPLPTGRALLDHWATRLPLMQRTILLALAAAHPGGLTKPELGRRTGYEPSGGSFGNALGRLRTLDLVEQHGGELRASAAFFEGG